MTRWLPSPPLSIALFALWLLLVQSLDAGNILLGVALALLWPVAAARFTNGAPRLRKPMVMAKLFARVVGDMLKSNAEVMWVLLTRRSSDIRSPFVFVPLELADPTGLALLATIVTFIPNGMTSFVKSSSRKIWCSLIPKL